jgi:hypothetical protein
MFDDFCRRPPKELGDLLNSTALYLCPASCKVQVTRELRRWGPPGFRLQILQTGVDQLDLSAGAVGAHRFSIRPMRVVPR